MAWTAYASTSSMISGSMLTSQSGTGSGLFLSNRDITDTSIPSLNDQTGILIDLYGCMGVGSINNPDADPNSLCAQWPVITSIVYNGSSAFEHITGTYPYIPLVSARIFLSKKKGGQSGNTYSNILSDSVYLTFEFSGVDTTTDTIIHSSQADLATDGYPMIYASGSYDNFPDYWYNYPDWESYCYAPSLYSTISTYADINTYLNQGYIYAGIYFYLKRQQYTQKRNPPAIPDIYPYAYAYVTAPNNDYCTASCSSSFINGSKVNVGGTWKGVQYAKVYVDGEWKNVKQMQVYRNDEWRTVPQEQTIIWAQK